MAMARGAPAAQAREPTKPLAVSSAPSISVRRDACHCISAGEVAEGANRGRMRFGSGFDASYHRASVMTGPHFRHIRGFIAGAISAVGQPESVTLPPHFAEREPGEEAAVRSGIKPRATKGKRDKLEWIIATHRLGP